MKNKLIIAHRGAHDKDNGIIENTISAFISAADIGADMIEFDIRKSTDDVLFVYHGKKEKIEYRGKKTEISKLSFVEVKDFSKKQGFDIPTFIEVLKSTDGKISLDIELKKDNGNEERIIDLLFNQLSKTKNKFVISSFIEKLLKIIKKKYPKVKLGIIAGHDKSKKDDPVCIKKCISSCADYWVIGKNIIGPIVLRKARKLNKPIFVWTANKEKDIQKYLKFDIIHGIITDKIQTVLKIRDNN